MNMDLKAYLAERRGLVNRALEAYLPAVRGPAFRVVQAMHYSLFAGGKRLRPILCLAAAEAVGGDPSEVLPVACALEMIHTYSLIHDDLPAMDDDDLRRGQPTCHKKFDEATAILAGDGLLTAAFQIMADAASRFEGRERDLLAVIRLIAAAAGYPGMVGGQMLDLQAEGRKVTLKELETIHRMKTGALLTASVRSGAVMAGGTRAEVTALTSYGEKFGLAFQVTDDLLDVEGEAGEMGKATGMDAQRQKATYPGVLGRQEAKEWAQRLVETAVADLQDFGPVAEPLREVARYLLVRRS
ncbi:MAG: polyprenyl synthetase family protein [Syntrophales bacterium]|nr:polyprenyl synthetase family protein [Syntrophales bacterium]MDD5643005.1 polyprenyl synthetase family protein [Syntrophales bacterium]